MPAIASWLKSWPICSNSLAVRCSCWTRSASNWFRIRPTYGITPEEAEGLRISLSEGQVTRRFWQATEPVYFNDLNIAADPDAEELRQWFGKLKVKSVIGQTVWVGKQPVGIIFGFDKADGSRFAPEDSRLIAILATQASVAINNSRLFDQVQMDLEVKTALLQEINHRVRNNLASIVGSCPWS